jgi:hypothetical protein
MDDNFYELSRRIFGAEYNIDIAEYQEPTTELEDLKGKAEEAARQRAFDSLPLEEQQASIRQKLQDPAARKKWFEANANTNTRHKIITDLDLGKGLISLYTLFKVDKEHLGSLCVDENFYKLSKRIFGAEYNTDIAEYQEPTAELEELKGKAEEAAKRRVFESLPLEEQRTIIRNKLQDSEARKKWFGSITNTRHKTIADLDLGKELSGLYTLFKVDKEGADRVTADRNFYKLSRRIF